MMPSDSTSSLVSQKRLGNYNASWVTLTESAEAHELAEFVRESADDYVKWSNATKERRAKLLTRFIQMHETSPQWSHYQGVEFSYEKLLERIQDFITLLVQASKSLLTREGTKKLSYSSLTTIRFDVLGLAAQFCEEVKRDVAVRRNWLVEVEKHCHYLASLHGLPTETRPKFYFGMLELDQLAMTAIAFSTCLDNSLQHMFLWTCMLYTAGRPGSFIATKQYLDCYAKYQHLTLLRMKDPLEFLVEFKIVSWKGYHTVLSWQTTFRLSPIRDETHLLADPGLLLIAIGLRRKAFAAHATLDSLLEGCELHITWKLELLEQPFFVASGPKGTDIRPGTPMKYDASREFLKKHCAYAGIGTQYMSAYCFRRGAATTLNRVLGSELTKSILHHQQFTDTIHKHYILPASQADVVAAITTGEINTLAHLSECDAPGLFRAEGISPHDILPLSFEEALIASPELRLLHVQRDLLEAYIKSGDGMPPLDSEEMAPLMSHLLQEERDFLDQFLGKTGGEGRPEGGAEHAGLADAGSAGLMLYGRLKQRCKKVIDDMRARHRRLVIEQQGKRDRPITIDDIEARLAQAQQPPDIARLLRGLVASENNSEKESAQNGGLPEVSVVECSAPDLKTSESVSDEELAGASVASTNPRRRMLDELISHKDAHKGPQPCPICLVDLSLSPAKRAHVFSAWYRVERHMRTRHPPHITRPYLASLDNDTVNELTINPEGSRTSLLHDSHLLAMSKTVDRVLAWCAGGTF